MPAHVIDPTASSFAVASPRLGDRPETSKQVSVLDVYGSLL